MSSATRALFGLTRAANSAALGTSSRNISSRFAISRLLKKVTPVMVPPGRFKLATRPSSTGSVPSVNTIGMVVPVFLASIAALVPPRRDEHRDPAADQVGQQRRKLIELAAGPALLDPQVLALDVTCFFEPLKKRGHVGGPWLRRDGAQDADHRHAGCCARAASGHAAAPPSTPRNSRRFMPPPKSSGRIVTD